MKVFRGYVGSERVLINSLGEVYRHRKGWERPQKPAQKVGAPYERWQDVPFNWANACPFWK